MKRIIKTTAIALMICTLLVPTCGFASEKQTLDEEVYVIDASNLSQ